MAPQLLAALGHGLSVHSAREEGWNYAAPKPNISPEQKKKLMEATALETPRSVMRTMFAVLKPYWTESSIPERVKAASLLALSLSMTWYAVQVSADFGHWQSSLVNTITQIGNHVSDIRPEMLTEILQGYPELESFLEDNPLIDGAIQTYPEITNMLYGPDFAEIVQANPDLQEILGKNPTLEEILMEFPDFEQAVAENPVLLEQLTAMRDELADQLSASDGNKSYFDRLWQLSGGELVGNTKLALQATFGVASQAADQAMSDDNTSVLQAYKNVWDSNDLATIALKYTGMMIVSYKSAQYLALRWRAWTTGYFSRKMMDAKAYLALSSRFNNIDNPGQRVQEDPAKFTAGAVSLTTGFMSSAMQIGTFGGILWGMGEIMGVDNGIFWAGAASVGVVTALTMYAGWQLPWIQAQQQKREADFRRSIDDIYEDADTIAQNGTEEVQLDLADKKFRPTIVNSVREIGTQVKLIVVDATVGNLMIPVPWIIGAFSVAAGTASVGTVQTINYAFNRVTSGLSYIVNRFDQLSAMKATGDRMYMLDRATDAGHYIHEEKTQQAKEIANSPELIARLNAPVMRMGA